MAVWGGNRFSLGASNWDKIWCVKEGLVHNHGGGWGTYGVSLWRYISKGWFSENISSEVGTGHSIQF